MQKFNRPSGKSDGKKKPFRSGKGSFKKDGDSSRSGGKRDEFKPKKSFSRDGDNDFKKDRKYSGEKSFSRDKKSYDDKGKRPFKRDGDGPVKRSFKKEGDFKEKRPFKRDGDNEKRSFKKEGDFKEKRPFKRRDEEGSEKRSYGSSRKEGVDFKEKRPFKRRDEEGSEKRSYGYKKDNSDFKEKRPFKRRDDDSSDNDFKEKRPFKRRNDDDTEKSYKEKRSFTRNKAIRKSSGPKKDEGHFRGNFDRKRSFSKNDKYSDKARLNESSFGQGEKFKSSYDDSKKFDRDEKKPFKKRFDSEGSSEKRLKYDDLEQGKGFTEYSKEKKSSPKPKQNNDGLTRLNKYLANAGIASRRDADTLIKSGVVKVNGVPVTEMGFKVKAGDVVTYGDEGVKSERKVYLLLNKPKDYITTVDDPQERKTVMDLIKGACKERIYPVGRLDRNTTGLLLFTNDGELTKKLTHPKHQIKKVYHVSLNKGLKPEHFKDILEGIELEDGKIAADDLAFVGEGKKEVGIEIHSGRNRIVRRIFEHLGYEIEKLDRITFAGLTKKDIPRGKFRFLTAKEVSFLQMIG
ncbi:MAG: pseudouridylate synthase [Bacteroidetes bacterium]|jgi:23S rRNA pseudouridine2605 synthase|nr:pseudouridylate synthase [Bacteroidota bacterium]